MKPRPKIHDRLAFEDYPIIDKKIDVIIPWKDNGDPMRRRALNFTLNYYHEISDGNIIVSEQDTETDFSDFPFIIHVKSKHVDTDMHRGAARNLGVPHVTSNYFAWIDSDVIIPPDQFGVRTAECDCVMFGYPYYCSEEKTVRLIEDPKSVFEDPDVDVLQKKLYINGTPFRRFQTGGAFIIKKSFHKKIGGWNDFLGGWGWEDTEYAIRAMAFGKVAKYVSPFFHLNHENAKHNEGTYTRQRAANKVLFDEIYNLSIANRLFNTNTIQGGCVTESDYKNSRIVLFEEKEKLSIKR